MYICVHEQVLSNAPQFIALPSLLPPPDHPTTRYLGADDAHDRNACLFRVTDLFPKPFRAWIHLHPKTSAGKAFLDSLGVIHGLGKEKDAEKRLR